MMPKLNCKKCKTKQITKLNKIEAVLMKMCVILIFLLKKGNHYEMAKLKLNFKKPD